MNGQNDRMNSSSRLDDQDRRGLRPLERDPLRRQLAEDDLRSP